MDLQNEVDVNELLQAHAHIWNQTYNFINSMSLKCAIQLGIPDIIHNHGQPIMSQSQLIAALPINPAKADGISRLMSILTHSGFFHRKKVSENDPEEAYALTNAGRLLVKDNPLSMIPSLLLSLDPIQMEPWHHLSTWFQNDHPTAYHTAHGMAIWEYAGHNPKLNHLFNNAMLCDSLLVSSIMLDKFKWVFEGLESLVDAGGGTGTMAKAIAQSFPHIKCTVLDLPHVVAGLQGANNLNYIGGNMFEAIPQADAVLLKWILHDWGDEECVRILRKCKEAISANGKTGNKGIIIDMVVEHHNKDSESVETQLCFDMLMMVQSTGRERNEHEWARLFYTAAHINKFKWVFEGLESLVDVGGGTGTMAKAIAQSFPHTKCTVLDLPHVVAGLQGTNNLNYIAGDMFEAIPQADAVLLKWILHDWGDEECVRVLQKCKEAISGNGKTGNKVIIIDIVVEHHNKDHESVETQLFLDMLMMVHFTGRERNEQEWVKLFYSAGFTDYKITQNFA